MLMNNTDTPCFYPSKNQLLLIQICFCEEASVYDLWGQWKTNVDFNKIDQGSYRLLPLVYKKLLKFNIKDTLMQKLKGIYRLTWYENNLLLKTASNVINIFNDNNIDSIILKGSSLLLNYYEDFALRPMADFDILIPADNAAKAIKILEENNWKIHNRGHRIKKTYKESFFSVWNSQDFINDNNYECDLHWHLFSEYCFENSDSTFWNNSIPCKIFESPARTLCHEDELLLVCIHGSKWNLTSPVRWIVDSLFILNKYPDLKWDRIINSCEKMKLICPVKATFNYLKNTFKVPIPDSFFMSLNSLSISAIDKKDFIVKSKPPGLLGYLSRLWYQYLRHKNIHHKPGFLHFLQQIWDLETIWQVPYYFLLMGLNRIKISLMKKYRK